MLVAQLLIYGFQLSWLIYGSLLVSSSLINDCVRLAQKNWLIRPQKSNARPLYTLSVVFLVFGYMAMCNVCNNVWRLHRTPDDQQPTAHRTYLSTLGP